MNPDHRLKSELAYQAERAARIAGHRPTPPHVLERYREARLGRLFPTDFVFAQLRDIRGREVLDFGCGDGALSVILARLGGRVTAVDISPELIDVAQKRATLEGVGDRIQFLVTDVTTSPLRADWFDAVVCNLVLHHVDLPSVLPRIVSALKPGGTAVFVEPISLSPRLQRVRDLVPIDKRASPGERPLSGEDVGLVLDQLADPQTTYFNLLGRLRRLLPNRHKTDIGYPVTRGCLFLLYGIDRLLLTLSPRLRTWCGTVAVVGTKPTATQHRGVEGLSRRGAA